MHASPRVRKGFLLLLLAIPMMVLFACNGAETPDGGTAAEPPTGLAELTQIDALLEETMAGNLAYNAPEDMLLDETATIQLVMSPAMTAEQLKQQVSESGQLVSAPLSVTPRMRAELSGTDPEAFVIQPLHADPEQLLSTIEATEWRWNITAKKDGQQELVLTVYRLVEYDEKEYWRQISYENNIQVQVTLAQRLRRLNWEWVAGIVLTGLLFPAIFRWADNRKKKRPKAQENKA